MKRSRAVDLLKDYAGGQAAPLTRRGRLQGRSCRSQSPSSRLSVPLVNRNAETVRQKLAHGREDEDEEDADVDRAEQRRWTLDSNY